MKSGPCEPVRVFSSESTRSLELRPLCPCYDADMPAEHSSAVSVFLPQNRSFAVTAVTTTSAGSRSRATKPVTLSLSEKTQMSQNYSS
ncbi:hypothetical protein SLA2020_520400 [Shorea laevis]